MTDIQVTKRKELKGGRKMKQLLNKKLLKNNKGFSLVELLIVIAIMGVLAVIAFNMFGGVLTNSKKRADDQQARNIEKAILTYCIDSNDWKLTGAKESDGTTAIPLVGETSKAFISTLMDPIYDAEKKEYGPYFSLKDPAQAKTVAVNANAYDPQWSTANGSGDYTGWKIEIYPDEQAVKVTPTKTATPETVAVK